jgi:hypothetical protein
VDLIMVDYVNIPIPRPLYDKLTKSLQGSGYRSTTEYIIFLIRKRLPDLESEDIQRRLKALGYIS